MKSVIKQLVHSYNLDLTDSVSDELARLDLGERQMLAEAVGVSPGVPLGLRRSSRPKNSSPNYG